MKKIFIIAFIIAIANSLVAQTIEDALNLSQNTYTSTARSAAVGGAFGALGGDMSVLSSNPAGIALYRSSEFIFTPNFEFNKNKSTDLSSSKYSFNFSNIGYIGTSIPRVSNNGWQNFNFGIAYNKLKGFNRNSTTGILDSQSSQLDVFTAKAQGKDDIRLDNFYEGLAWDTQIINNSDKEDKTRYFAIDENNNFDQERKIEERGSIGEFDISFGANYNHKLYLGASIGIQSIYSKTVSKYLEVPYLATADAFSELDSYTFTNKNKTEGSGVNFKMGAIYKVDNNLRFGLAIHTPTFMRLNDKYTVSITSQFVNADEEGYTQYNSYSNGEYSYSLRTPWKFLASTAYTFGKKGFLSAEVDYVDYRDMEYYNGSDDSDFTKENKDIDDTYTKTLNYRIGGEYRINHIFSIRGGFAHTDNPRKNNTTEIIRNGKKENLQLNKDYQYNTYSLGWGLRQNNFFFDMTYIFNDRDKESLYYNHNNDIVSETITETDKNHQIRMTFGFKF